MTDDTTHVALHELVNSLGALLLDLQLTTEQHPVPVTDDQLARWTDLAATAAAQAHALRVHLP